MTEVYLNLSKEGIEKTKTIASREALETHEEYGKDDLLYPDIDLTCSEISFEESSNELCINGDLTNPTGTKLGYLSIDMPLDFDLVISIIESYRKKLGKLKTVLEATK